MDGRISVAYLQSYIKSKDQNPELAKDYFLKLAEETGEVAQAMRKDLRPCQPEDVRGTIHAELGDVICYALAVASCYGIDMESVIPQKAAASSARYPEPVPFELDR